MERHLLNAYAREQQIIDRNSADAELYAAALGVSEAKGVQSMMCDLGFAVKPVLIIDAEATEHILHQHGFGKMKHMDLPRLRLQDEVKSNRLRVRRVKSEDNLADIGTKALSNKTIRKHATSMACIDAQENLKSGDTLELWVGKSEQADQSSPAQQKTSLESTGGHARQQRARWRGQSSLAEGDQERQLVASTKFLVDEDIVGATMERLLALLHSNSLSVDFDGLVPRKRQLISITTC